MRSTYNKQLSYSLWPEQDRTTWEEAMVPRAFLDEKGVFRHGIRTPFSG